MDRKKRTPAILPGSELLAEYKLEIAFGQGRTTNGPNLHLIIPWDSSGRIAAEGDVLMGFCNFCIQKGHEQIIKRDPGQTFCEKCKRLLPDDRVMDNMIARMTTERIATRLTKLFYQMKGLADIYLKFHREDIRYEPQDFNLKKLARARSTRAPAIYTLKRILDDTRGGASLEERIKAFLKA